LAPDDAEVDLYEKVVGRRDNFIRALYEEQQKTMLEGKFCPYELLLERDLIIGYSFPRPVDDEATKTLRAIAPLHGEMLRTIRNLDPADFETFCAQVLKLLGARDSHTTRLSQDGGADFFARVSIRPATPFDMRFTSFEDEFGMLIVGQAKAYAVERPVGVSAVRELVGTIAMFQFDDSAYDISFERRLCDPILPLLMTTGVFSSTAKTLAHRYGVIAKDGAQLATFLCQNGIGISTIGDAKVFDHDIFLRWLRD
jgi:restriction endonuclease Mrr